MAVFNGSAADIETKKNKVNSISSTPSDENYPSEKAVKDYVDNNSSGGGVSEDILNDKIEQYLNAWIEVYQPESKADKVSELEVGSEDYYPNCIAVKNYVDGQVGDIEAALDRVIEIQEELIGGGGGGGGAQEITFTIDGISYTAEQGMIWEEWCESEYNTIGAYVSDESGFIYFIDSGEERQLRESRDNDINGSDEIIADEFYAGVV
jgi:hypothetical protein